MKKNKGFTLIEVMVVMVIIMILAAITITAILDRDDTSQTTPPAIEQPAEQETPDTSTEKSL